MPPLPDLGGTRQLFTTPDVTLAWTQADDACKSKVAPTFQVVLSAGATLDEMAGIVNVTTGAFNLTLALPVEGTYTWSVKTFNGRQWCGFAPPRTLEVCFPTQNSKPTLSAPRDGGRPVFDQVVLRWNITEDANSCGSTIRHLLKYRADNDPLAVTTVVVDSLSSSAMVSLTAGVTYTWWVVVDTGYFNITSDTRNLTACKRVAPSVAEPIYPDPAAPTVLTSIANFVWALNTSGESCDVNGVVPGPPKVTYQVRVSTSATMASPVFDSATTDTQIVVASLQDGEEYFWQITATNQAGLRSTTVPHAFVVCIPTGPTAPGLVAPGTGANIYKSEEEQLVFKITAPTSMGKQCHNISDDRLAGYRLFVGMGTEEMYGAPFATLPITAPRHNMSGGKQVVVFENVTGLQRLVYGRQFWSASTSNREGSETRAAATYSVTVCDNP
jgi:hypothetical protein